MRAVPWVVVTALAAFPVAAGVARAQEPSEAEAIAAALKAPVTATFTGTRAALVVDEIAKQASLNLVMRGVDVNAPVSLEVRAQPADAVLRQLEQQLKLGRQTWCGAVVLLPQGKNLPQEAPAAANALLDARTTQTIEGQPFLLAIERLRTGRGMTIELTTRARARVASVADTITLRAFRMQVRHLLTHLGAKCDLTWALGADGKTITFDNASARDIDAGELVVTRQLAEAGPQVDVAKAVNELKQPGTRESARRQLVAAGKRAGPELVKLIKDADPNLARQGLQLLGQVGATDQGDAVLAVFRDGGRPTEVRAEAGNTLGALKATAAVPALIDGLNDESFRVAAAARNALVSVGAAAIPPLLARWKPASATPQGMDGLVYGGLLVLGNIPDKAATDTLLGALKTKQGPRAVPLRHHAAIGLGFTGDPKVVEPLIQALDEERDFLVASYISRSLGWITKTQDVQPQASSWRTWWQNNKKRFGEASSPDAGEIQLKLGPDGLPILDDKPADKPR
jgi:HEAT repeat protein